MSEVKKRVELSDDVLDTVSGGVILNPSGVVNQANGKKYKWLKYDRAGAFAYVCELGDVSEGEKIAALQAAGYIGGEI